jgi:hypothetical protein
VTKDLNNYIRRSKYSGTFGEDPGASLKIVRIRITCALPRAGFYYHLEAGLYQGWDYGGNKPDTPLPRIGLSRNTDDHRMASFQVPSDRKDATEKPLDSTAQGHTRNLTAG